MANTSSPIVPPLILSTIFDLQSDNQQFEYSRVGNPSRLLLEKELAALESARFCLATSSGQSALSLVLSTLKQGDHVVIHTDAYDGTLRLLEKVFASFGVSCSRVDLTNPQIVISVFTKTTKLIIFETPTNPLLEIIDIKAVTRMAHSKNIKVVVDNTMAGPALQNPLILDADLIVTSLTKSLNGHSDVTGGAVITNDAAWFSILSFHHHTLGIGLSPFDSFMVMRGLKTFKLRVKQMQKNAGKIARFLQRHKDIERVSFPGLSSHLQHKLVKLQMRGPGTIISFWIKGNGMKTKSFLKNLKLIRVAHSFGGTETLIQHPRSMMQQSLSNHILNKKGITQNLVRLSVGLEDPSEIIKDINQAIS